MFLTLSYPIFSIFCPICPYMEIWSKTPGILKFFEFSYSTRSAILIRFQRAFNHSSKLFLTQVIPFFLFFYPTCPYMEIRSHNPGFFIFFIFLLYKNRPTKLFLTKIIQFFLYIVQYAHIMVIKKYLLCFVYLVSN